MPIINLFNRKYFEISGNLSILESATKAGITLPHSCRHGKCGVCKAKVLTGETFLVQQEESLTQEETDRGIILTCCRTAVTNVDLDIVDLGRFAEIKVKTLPCRIDDINIVTPNVVHVTLRLPPNNQLDYVAGQYIEIIGPGGIRRSYSIANSPGIDAKLELHISRINQGVMSNYWFNQAKPEDLLRLEGPFGTFCLPDILKNNIVFLATGTGIAPVKAILEELSDNNSITNTTNILVYWGARIPSDIYWTPQIPVIKFIPVLSRPPTKWTGRTGYVQNTLLEDNINLQDSDVFACGSDAMIKAAKLALFRNGLDPRNFHYDAFVSS